MYLYIMYVYIYILCISVLIYVVYVCMYVCVYHLKSLLLQISACDSLVCGCIPDSHPHRVTSTKFRINTVVSLDDRHIVARNR